jgi:menaquinone-specific isochorismate synthase
LRLKTLTHLRTPIQLELTQTADTAALVKALHPTPALGAFPKEEGVEWLKAFDSRTPRKHYGAPLGCCYGNSISIVVAIRNVQWTPNGLAIGAGCGVIAESKQEREWNEIQLKTEAIFETLGFKTAALPKELSKALSTVG